MRNFREAITQNILQGKTMLGTFLQLPSPEITEIFGYCGYDFVIIDTEHSVTGPETALAMARAAEASGIYTIIRTPDFTETSIKKVLDIGADAVLCPNVQTVEDVKNVINLSKYAPVGNRGACPGVRANQYGAEPGTDYFARANREVAVMVQIENKTACDSISEILKLEGMDGILLGPVDLSMSLGHPGEINHPEVVAAMDEVLRMAKEAGVAVLTFAMDIASAQSWIDKGLNMLAYHIDSMLIRETILGIRNSLKT